MKHPKIWAFLVVVVFNFLVLPWRSNSWKCSFFLYQENLKFYYAQKYYNYLLTLHLFLKIWFELEGWRPFLTCICCHSYVSFSFVLNPWLHETPFFVSIQVPTGLNPPNDPVSLDGYTISVDWQRPAGNTGVLSQYVLLAYNQDIPLLTPVTAVFTDTSSEENSGKAFALCFYWLKVQMQELWWQIIMYYLHIFGMGKMT